MQRFLIVQPGATDFDEQGRIKGTLDIPLNESGARQVARTVDELADLDLDCIYSSPCQSAQQTAAALAEGRNIRVKPLEKLRNLDHGLWHGKLIQDVKRKQPKVYRQWQEHPETVCPPEGESLASAERRVRSALMKLLKKHKEGVVALVVSEPLASVVRSVLEDRRPGDLWKAECDSGAWEMFDIPDKLATLGG